MGWLRQLMGEAGPKIRSFDALAAALIGHPDWPRDSHTQLRSLGALLSKLDRGTDLEWLADRVHVQHIAAQVLGCPLSSIQAGLGARLADTDQQRRRFRFDEVRFARPLELVEETLPPGFPSVVQQPGAWQRLWWHAPSGSGRSLLRHWLAARGLARVELVHDAQHALELLAQLPQDGTTAPLFIELLGPAGALASAAPPEHGLYCVACSEPPQHPRWHELRSPNIDSYLKALVAWLVPRLPKDGHFDAAGALSWLHDRVPDSVRDGFGTALGLLGLVDEFGVDKLAQKPLDQVARAFVSEKLKLALSRGSSEAQWLSERGFEVLVGMAERALATGVPWATARSESDWLALVPEEFQRGVDEEWARVALSKAVSRSAAKELESALHKLQPGAFRVVRALRAAGLLRQQGQGLSFAPHWLGRVLEAAAFEHLIDGSAFHWGEAMLSARTASRIVASLHQRFSDEDFSALEAVLELDATQSPAYAAAVEACFRALGLVLGEGGAVPSELLTALWEEQRELLMQIAADDLPQPRIGYDSTDPLLGSGAFYLAALAISAELPERGVPKHPVLHPWAEKVVDARFDALLSCIASWLDGAGAPYRELACQLVDRLALHWVEKAASGKNPSAIFLDTRGEPHELEWPSLLLREIKVGNLSPTWLERLPAKPSALDNIHALCAKKPTLWDQLLEQLWTIWAQAAAPEAMVRLFCARAEWCWPALPENAVTAAVQGATIANIAVPFKQLNADHWSQLRDWLPQHGATHLADATLWQHVPFGVAELWLRSDALRSQRELALSVLWARDATATLPLYETALRHDTTGKLLAALLAATPIEHAAPLTSWLKGAVSKPGAPVALVDAARRFLLEQVQRRAVGFREAYTLLDELERRGRRMGG
jgi:hypothetical protein